jgi:hypothetical protein
MPQYIYVICEKSEGSNPVKIGLSQDPEKRLKQLQTGHSAPLVLFHKEEIENKNAPSLERIIHRTLSQHRTSGEWFALTPQDAVAEVKHAIIRYGDVDDLAIRVRSRTI